MSSKGGKTKSDIGGSKTKGQNKNAGGKAQSDNMVASRGATKGKRSGEEVKPVAKIPQSRDDASSNWKTLLQSQSKGAPSSKSTPQAAGGSRTVTNEAKDFKRFRSSSNSDASSSTTDVRSRSVSQTRSSSQISMVSETTSSTGTDNVEIESDNDGGVARSQQCQKVKQEFRALGLLESKESSKDPSTHRGRSSRPEEKTPRALPAAGLKKPPGGGLNDFGFFDYNHYGILRTPIISEHKEFMVDTGIIAMDCEMVGVGPMKESALARVSIVNEFGYCLYNKFVKPKLEVTDYRTQFSGIRENDLKHAVPFQLVTREVSEILRGHILVGHSLKSDLSVLFLNHPKARTRDTAMYFKRIFHSKTPKLKTLVKKVFGIDIQQGEHNSIVDAQAAMSLYRLYQKDWEISVRQSNRGINILKQTLDEFKEYGYEYKPNQPQMDRQQNWYGVPEENFFRYHSRGVEYQSVSPPPQPLPNFPPPENYYASFNNVPYNLPYYPPQPPVPVPPLVHFNQFNTVPFPNYSHGKGMGTIYYSQTGDMSYTPWDAPFACSNFANYNSATLNPFGGAMLYPHPPVHPQIMEQPVLIPLYPMPWVHMEFLNM